MVRWNKAYLKGTKTIVGIDDKRPVKEEFECMACGTTMIAKRGNKRIHHFAHKEKTVNCDPEGYFHKLGKKIFKEIYDGTVEFVIKPSSAILDLKKEYGECLIEKKEEGTTLKRKADLYIKHLNDESKDVSVEIFYSHQITKKKLDVGFRIIEVRLPISVSSQDDTDSDEIEQFIRKVCTPPLKEGDNIRFYNFEDDVIYQEVSSSPNIYHRYDNNEQECLGTDEGRRITPNFKNYITYSKKTDIEQNNSLPNKANKYPEFVPAKNENSQKREIPISGHLLQPRMEAIKPTIDFEVDASVKNKYPNIRHQPAVLPTYKNVIDIIVKDGENEYWLGIDYKKYEVFKGDFEKKIPDVWKSAVREYIMNLKPVK